MQLVVGRLAHTITWTEFKKDGANHRGAETLLNDFEDVERSWKKVGPDRDSLKPSSITNCTCFWWLVDADATPMTDQVEKHIKSVHVLMLLV